MIVNGRSSVADALGRRLDTLRRELDSVRALGSWSDLPRLRWTFRGAEVELQRSPALATRRAAKEIGLLLELVTIATERDGSYAPAEIASACSTGLELLADAARGRTTDAEFQRLYQDVRRPWDSYLSVLAPESTDESSSTAAARAGGTSESSLFVESTGQDQTGADRAALSRLFGVSAGPTVQPPIPPPLREAPAPPIPTPPSPTVVPSSRSNVVDDELGASLLLDPELSAAFRADAAELLERIDGLIHELADPDHATDAPLELGRCLHTLKGAAGAVGLASITHRVHALEDRLEAIREGQETIAPSFINEVRELLLRIEEVVASSPSDAASPSSLEARESPGGSSPESDSASGSSGQESTTSIESSSDSMVRVARARLDELLDLAAELLVRSAPRVVRAGRVKELATVARTCRNRLSASVDQLSAFHAHIVAPQTPGSASLDLRKEAPRLTRALTEEVEDLALLAEMARSTAESLLDEVEASALLADRLWDLLHEIRVVPIRPLLHRLDRVARAAAGMEGKEVEVELEGEENGLDRLVQDRLYEPLLHIIRNAVGHGIETPEVRRRNGKPAVGRLTIQCSRDGEAFVVTVRDDGSGLDYQAIEGKARKLGLIPPDQLADRSQLQSLIFLPGFSTRAAAGAVAGRGLGMDVVAQEIARLQGGVSLQSRPGLGTSVRVRLPARMSLQQVMIVRIDGQSFGLPLHHVLAEPAEATSAGSFPNEPKLSARAALGFPPAPPSAPSATLRVRVGGTDVSFEVDSIEGPRELVVRPAHPLLSVHPTVSGTSLSADDDVVLVLDPSGLAGRPYDAGLVALAPRPHPVLLVDDSISVRRTVGRCLLALGLDFEEASDGVEALQKLRARPYRVLLTDIDMPRMNGFELIESLSRLNSSLRPPVIVSSSRTDSATRRRALELGAQAFLVKPTGVEELAEAIGPLLRARSSS